MNRIKCNSCGLINVSSDQNCRRCGINLHASENVAPAKPSALDYNPSRLKTYIAIIIFVLICAGSYTLYQSKAEEEAARKREAESRIKFQEKLNRDIDKQRREEIERNKAIFGR